MVPVIAPLPPQAPCTLDDLAAWARHYAFYFLKQHGNIRPAFFFLTAEGSYGVMICAVGDFGPSDKDTYAKLCQTVAIAANITRAVLCVEIWASEQAIPMPPTGSPQPPDVRPSEDPNRKELVCLVQQTCDTCVSTFFNIVRLDGPKREFFNLTDNTDMGRMESVPREQSDSRFDWLLPAAEQPPDIRAAARVWLELQGVDLKKLILKPHKRRR